jgi:hypothetical protein
MVKPQDEVPVVPVHQSYLAIMEDCIASDTSAGIMTPPEDDAEINAESSRSEDEISGKAVELTSEHLSIFETFIVTFFKALNKAGHTRDIIGSTYPTLSPGRVLLRDACEVIYQEITGPVKKIVTTPEANIPAVKGASGSKEVEAAVKTSDQVIEAMSPEVSDHDIATLVFHWTHLAVFDGHKRIEVG